MCTRDRPPQPRLRLPPREGGAERFTPISNGDQRWERGHGYRGCLADAILSTVLAVLVLVILGTLREVVLLRSEQAAFRQLITNPPALSFVRSKAPPVSNVRLARSLGSVTGQVLGS